MTKQNIMLTPGPTPLPPEVLEALSRPIIHHRTEEFGQVFVDVEEGLKRIFRTKSPVYMMASSGTGAMEAAAVNLLSPSDKVIVLSTGVFGDRFAAILKAYGVSPIVVQEEWGNAANPETLKKALLDNPGVKAVFFQHTDTSTGIVNDIKALSEVVHKNSQALVVVDSVSGLAAEPLEMDAWGLDVVASASQKGLMNAPGLSFAAVNDRAWTAVEAAKLPRFYFDWRTMKKFLPTRQTPYTPSINLIVAQLEAIKLIEKEGLENVWKNTDELAAYTRKRVQEIGLTLFAKDPANILTAALVPETVDSKKLVAQILRETGISIAGGQGKLEGRLIRIAHMGYITRHDVDEGFKALEKYLPRKEKV
jgi:aspartate aminotransferase-like enzyme